MKTEQSQLIKMIEFWNDVATKDILCPRSVVNTLDMTTKEVVDVVGVRRGGKSSVLKLLIKRLQLNHFLYMNFEDPFFLEHDQANIIEELISTYQEYFHPELKYLFFDEIQVIKNWEKAIRKLRDSGKYKIFITGSSSKLMSSELATVLTGRHLSYELMPLTFPEYLQFKRLKLKNKKDLVLKNKSVLKKFTEYLAGGGFPEVVVTGSQVLLKQYFFDILQKDIVMRHGIREVAVLEKMAIFLMSHATKIISVESLKKTFKISYKTATLYLDYFQESFLFFELPQFSYSLKKQQKAFKKYYAIDCGLANVTAIRFSEDKGRMLENCVYLHLRQNYEEIYYYKTKNNLEVDFVAKNEKETKLIQVTWSLKDEKTKERELRALLTALTEIKLKQALILTYEEDEDEITVDGKNILIKPVYRWLLENEF